MNSFLKIMQKTEKCVKKSKELYSLLSPELQTLGLDVREHTSSFCFQVFKNDGNIGLSISIPPDAFGNDSDSIIYETALLDSSGDLIYDDDLGYDTERNPIIKVDNITDLPPADTVPNTFVFVGEDIYKKNRKGDKWVLLPKDDSDTFD